MSFAAFNLLFPIVVAVHNIDEYRGYTDFVHSYPSWLDEKLTRRVLGWAADTFNIGGYRVSGGNLFLSERCLTNSFEDCDYRTRTQLPWALFLVT